MEQDGTPGSKGSQQALMLRLYASRADIPGGAGKGSLLSKTGGYRHRDGLIHTTWRELQRATLPWGPSPCLRSTAGHVGHRH